MKKNKLIIILTLNLFFLTNCDKEVKSEVTKNESQIKTQELTKNEEIGRLTFTKEAYKLLENFSQRKNEIKEKLKTLSKEEANKLYKEYSNENNNFFIKNELGYILTDSFFTEEEKKQNEETGILIELSEEECEKTNAILKKYDLKLYGNGVYFELFPNSYSFYYDIFKDYVTDDYKEFLELKLQEADRPFSDENGFAISLQEIGDRIVAWEKFLEKYPNSDIKDYDPINLFTYRMEYIIGINDVPIKDRGAFKTFSTIPPEKEKEFERFMKKYPNSPTVEGIKYFLENYENSDIQVLTYQKLMELE